VIGGSGLIRLEPAAGAARLMAGTCRRTDLCLAPSSRNPGGHRVLGRCPRLQVSLAFGQKTGDAEARRKKTCPITADVR
jgi:hypothetical protein